jgi:hypothetical protein
VAVERVINKAAVALLAVSLKSSRRNVVRRRGVALEAIAEIVKHESAGAIGNQHVATGSKGCGITGITDTACCGSYGIDQRVVHFGKLGIGTRMALLTFGHGQIAEFSIGDPQGLVYRRRRNVCPVNGGNAKDKSSYERHAQQNLLFHILSAPFA